MRKSRSGIDTSHLACYHSFTVVAQTETQNAGKEMVNMKRLIALILAAALALSLVACGGDGADHTTTGENEPSSDPSNTDYIDDTESTNPSNDNENETYWEVGDTITLDSVEFTLDSYQFERCLYNVRNGDYLSPVDLRSLSENDLMYNSLTTDNPYYADDEHIFLLLSFTQKNIGKESVQIIAPESDMLVIYSDGYTFDFLSDTGSGGGWKDENSFNGFSFTEMEPLSPSFECRACILLPIEVMENEDASLLLQVKEQTYKLR